MDAPKVSLITILIIVFLAELPCLIRTTSLTLYSQGDTLRVIGGTVAGNVLALVVGLGIGKALLYFFDLDSGGRIADYVSGMIFMLIGLYIMFWGD